MSCQGYVRAFGLEMGYFEVNRLWRSSFLAIYAGVISKFLIFNWISTGFLYIFAQFKVLKSSHPWSFLYFTDEE